MKIPILNKGYNLSDYVFEVKFPGEVEIMPPIGTQVTETTVIATGSSHKIKESINLIQFFGKLTKRDIDDGLACFDGEVVKKGDVVFSRPIFGVRKKDIKVTSDGLVSLTEIPRGKIQILDTKEKLTLRAGIKGEVTGIYPEGVVHVTSQAYSLELFRVFGKKVGGLVKKLTKNDFETKKKNLLVKHDLSNQIAYVEFPINKEVYKVLLIAGAIAILTPGVDSEFFKSIDKLKRINITLLEGWGRVFTPKLISDYLSRLDGMYVEIVPGGTKTYYGRLISPVIPDKTEIDEDVLRIDPKVGDMVEIFEPPYWAKEGEIIEVLEKDEIISIKLKSGEVIVVPAQSVYKPVL